MCSSTEPRHTMKSRYNQQRAEQNNKNRCENFRKLSQENMCCVSTSTIIIRAAFEWNVRSHKSQSVGTLSCAPHRWPRVCGLQTWMAYVRWPSSTVWVRPVALSNYLQIAALAPLAQAFAWTIELLMTTIQIERSSCNFQSGCAFGHIGAQCGGSVIALQCLHRKCYSPYQIHVSRRIVTHPVFGLVVPITSFCLVSQVSPTNVSYPNLLLNLQRAEPTNSIDSCVRGSQSITDHSSSRL